MERNKKKQMRKRDWKMCEIGMQNVRKINEKRLPKWPERMLERFQNSQSYLYMSAPKNIRQETWCQVDRINHRILNTKQHIFVFQIVVML